MKALPTSTARGRRPGLLAIALGSLVAFAASGAATAQPQGFARAGNAPLASFAGYGHQDADYGHDRGHLDDVVCTAEGCRAAPRHRISTCQPNFARIAYERGLRDGRRTGFDLGYQDGHYGAGFCDIPRGNLRRMSPHYRRGFRAAYRTAYRDGYDRGSCAPVVRRHPRRTKRSRWSWSVRW